MALTAKELKQLRELQEKEGIRPPKLTSEMIEDIEKNIRKAYDSTPTFMQYTKDAHNNYCEMLKQLSNDNTTLLNAVKHYMSNDNKQD